jgi:hypothetical protein
LLLKNGAAYEQTTFFIERKTGKEVTKLVRFNDHMRKINEKFVLTFPISKQNPDPILIDSLKTVSIAKFHPIFQAYKKGKFNGITDEDFKNILKYM